MRNQYKVLAERYDIVKQLLNEVELYHLTDKSHLNSFVTQGVNADLTGSKYFGAGASQGKGFYVWRDKRYALHNIGIDQNIREPVIVVLDYPNLNTRDFAPDYEVCYSHIIKLILANLPNILKHQQQLNQLGIYPIYNNGNNQPPTSFRVRRPDNGRGNISFTSDYDVHIKDGENMSSFMNGLEQVDRQLADSIKAQVINQCPAVKYIGSTKLWPSRIEDSQGNIIWSNNKL